MKTVIFGSFTFNHIYFLLYALARVVHQILKDNCKGDEIADDFFSVYLIVISRLLSVIPYLIYKKLSKSRREIKGNNLKKDIIYIYMLH